MFFVRASQRVLQWIFGRKSWRSTSKLRISARNSAISLKSAIVQAKDRRSFCETRHTLIQGPCLLTFLQGSPLPWRFSICKRWHRQTTGDVKETISLKQTFMESAHFNLQLQLRSYHPSYRRASMRKSPPCFFDRDGLTGRVDALGGWAYELPDVYWVFCFGFWFLVDRWWNEIEVNLE